MRSLIIKWSLVIFCNLAVIEGLFFAAWKFQLIPIAAPSYSIRNVYSRFLIHDPVIGVWHEPNTVFRHNKTCFDVTYTTNSVGARDVERTRRTSTDRILLLGDSFIEGWGVEEKSRLSNLLEKRLDLEVLNFGASGHFGPTQYYLLYESLAKDFDHSTVMIGILPDNDFLDDDLNYAKKGLYKKNYRPYFNGEDNRLVYLNPDLRNQVESPGDTAARFLQEFTFSYRQYRSIARQFSAQFSSQPREYSGYFDFTPEQLSRLKFVLSKIKHAANGKRIIVFTIPRLNDFRRLDAVSADPPLIAALTNLSTELNFEYFDLIKPMRNSVPDFESYFLECDGHWSAAGNETAEKIIGEMLEKNRLSPH